MKITGLSGTGEKAVYKFSLGMRQRLGIARALIHQPKILILDEPVNGLDPMGIKEIRELFFYHYEPRKSFIVSFKLLSAA